MYQELTLQPRIVKEFSQILPPLRGTDISSLEKDILESGMLNPIIVWNGICIDGIHRLKIAKKHKLEYQIKQLNFDNKHDAMLWVFEHNIGSRNQSTFSKIVSGLKFEDHYKAKEKQRMSQESGKKDSSKTVKPINTTRLIAKKIGVAHSYISYVKYILKHGTEDLINKCYNEEVSINDAYHIAKKYGLDGNTQEGQYINQLIKGDCLEVMPRMIKDNMEGKISCIITSPPCNCVKKNNDMSYNECLQWFCRVIKNSTKLLRSGGSLIWVVPEIINCRNKSNDDSNSHTLYTDLVHMVQKKECGLKFHQSIIWNKKCTDIKNSAFDSDKSPNSHSLVPNHEYIIIWYKNRLNLPDITDVASDISKEDFLEWTNSVWTLSPQSSHNNHHATYPEELVERLIKLFSYPGDIILDNFNNGSGTTMDVASKLGRKWIGIEQEAG